MGYFVAFAGQCFTDVHRHGSLLRGERWEDIQGVTSRQEAEGETTPLSEDNPFPPTRYAE